MTADSDAAAAPAVPPRPDDGAETPAAALSSSLSSVSPGVPPLLKSDSTASAGRFSVTSHVSIPVTGALPYGSLRLVHPPAPSPPAPGAGSDDAALRPEAGAGAGTAPSPDACLQLGDVFLVLALPDYASAGCDAMAFHSTGPTGFLGVREVPPGPHFLWVSDPNGLSRTGYWFMTGSAGRLRVKQWDPYNEVLGDAASRVEVGAQRDSLGSLFPKLVPYGRACRAAAPASPDNNDDDDDDDDDDGPPPPPKDPPKRFSVPDPDLAPADDAVAWRQLTSAVTADLLRRITGKRAAVEWPISTADTAEGEIVSVPPGRLVQAAVGCRLRFLFPPDDAVDLHRLTLAEDDGVSSALRDASPAVLAVLSSLPAAAAEACVVGEFQFAFLTGMHLTNLSCLDQWWHFLLRVFLRAYGLVRTRPALCRTLLQTLHAQLAYSDRYLAGPPASKDGAGAGTGVLDTVPRNKDRLREALTVYKRCLNETLLGLGEAATAEQTAVGHAFVCLEAWFWRYGWDLRSDFVPGEMGWSGGDRGSGDDEEYIPVVVRLDDAGREVGLVSWS